MKNAFLILVLVFFSISSYAQNKSTLAQCEEFKKTITLDPSFRTGTYMVPLDYRNPTGTKIPIFYWIRRGSNITKPPVILVHGGPGGNSWRYYSIFKNVKYDGDILSIDNRNEGCSNVLDYVFKPEQYRYFRSRSIVLDLEVLRTQLYGPNSKWRYFGQSRGSFIAHHYLEMFPNSLESLQAHGFALSTPQQMINYTYYRSKFIARSSKRFFEKFPQVKSIYIQAQEYFGKYKVCLPLNYLQQNLPIPRQPKVCGSVIADGIASRLTNYSRWGDLANSLMALANPDGRLNPQKAFLFFHAELNGNIYVGHLNYIFGTAGRDLASASPQMYDLILNDPDLKKALLSEGRFVASALYPIYLKSGAQPFTATVDSISFPKVKATLQEYERKNGRKFPFVLFTSYYDPIAPPEMYIEEERMLHPYVRVVTLNNSGHEGYDTEPSVRAWIFR